MLTLCGEDEASPLLFYSRPMHVGDLFLACVDLGQVGIGALGVVTEVTIKCVQRHQLLETTSVMTRAQVRAHHQSLLQDNKHVRWLPLFSRIASPLISEVGKS